MVSEMKEEKSVLMLSMCDHDNMELPVLQGFTFTAADAALLSEYLNDFKEGNASSPKHMAQKIPLSYPPHMQLFQVFLLSWIPRPQCCCLSRTAHKCIGSTECQISDHCSQAPVWWVQHSSFTLTDISHIQIWEMMWCSLQQWWKVQNSRMVRICSD